MVDYSLTAAPEAPHPEGSRPRGNGGTGCDGLAGVSSVFGTAGRVSQGAALPAHFLHVVPAGAPGGPRTISAPLPGLPRSRPRQDGGGAPSKPPAGAAPGGASGRTQAQQGQTESSLLCAFFQV